MFNGKGANNKINHLHEHSLLLVYKDNNSSFKELPVPNPEYTIYLCYCKFRLVTPPPMVGAEGTKIFDFDNPRLLEKALSGTELHRKLLLLTKKD